jgi:hypothetical protein
MSFYACVQQVDDPNDAMENYNNPMREPQQRPQSTSVSGRQHRRGGPNGPTDHDRRRSAADVNLSHIASAAAKATSDEHKHDTDYSSQISQEAEATRSQTSRFESEFTERVLSHALKLKKKCKELKVQLAEAISLRKEQEDICKRQIMEHQSVCDAIVDQLRVHHSKVCNALHCATLNRIALI